MPAKFSIKWDSYNQNICNGFTQLQQDGEFVDMTLAADGYFVKVHQTIMVLASPYLKAVLKSLPCRHPVVFLSIKHEILCFILEYIYKGEVEIPKSKISEFVKSANLLKINGVTDDLESQMEQVVCGNNKNTVPCAFGKNAIVEESQNVTRISTLNDTANITETLKEQTETLPENEICSSDIAYAQKIVSYDINTKIKKGHSKESRAISFANGADFLEYCTKAGIPNIDIQESYNYSKTNSNINTEVQSTQIDTQIEIERLDLSELMDTSVPKNANQDMQYGNEQSPLTEDILSNINFENVQPATEVTSPNENVLCSLLKLLEKPQSNDNRELAKPVAKITVMPNENESTLLQYSYSNRGSLQVILNRYIYYVHHTSYNTRRRWRCVDYRRKKCPALIDTDGDVITQRVKDHNHSFHDKQIMAKVKQNSIFSAVQEAAESAKTKTNLRLRFDEGNMFD